MSHAFWWLPSHRGAVLLVLLVLAAVFFVVLERQGRPLEEAGASILDYEFSWNRAGAETVLTAWKGLEATARKQIVIDFGFLLVYPPLIALACAAPLGRGLTGSRPTTTSATSMGISSSSARCSPGVPGGSWSSWPGPDGCRSRCAKPTSS